MVDYRKIYKDYFGIEFGSDYVVHHIDGNRGNNNIDNLLLLPSKLHAKYHFQKAIVEAQPVPTRISGNRANADNYYLSCLDDFMNTLKECNQWHDFKLYLCGVLPNIHGIEL